MLCFDSSEFFGDLADRCIPADLVETAAGVLFQWMQQTVLAVDVMIQPGCFIAEITLRTRVLVVAFDANKLSIILATKLNLDATVGATEDTTGNFPIRHDCSMNLN